MDKTAIARAGKALILLIKNKFHIGKSCREILGTVIGRGIINNDYLNFKPIRGGLHGPKALLEEMLDIIIDYDDR